MKSKIKTLSQKASEDSIMTASNFGKRIRQQREAKKLSMAQLYALSGVSSATICKVEGGHLPSLEVMLKIGYALDLSHDEIMSYLFNEVSTVRSRSGIEVEIKTLLRGYGIKEEARLNEIVNYIRYHVKK